MMNLIQRDDAIRLFVEDAKKEIARGSLVFLGGDFNEPSHLNWVEATKDSANHHGVVIPWTVTTVLDENGFRDAYRTMYPDPVKNPGYTYPSDLFIEPKGIWPTDHKGVIATFEVR